MLSSPRPDPDNPCGIVDILDFPLDPPDADEVMFGGQDFGRFRRRYDGYHTGEDWWKNRGRSNFGVPVYSIGHGTITFAESLGWGRDKGVIIIRHHFSDGSEVLSFYGHLDPSSVNLEAGACVSRGDQIGRIGDPTSGPHLHFEIRTHMPYETGGGYWANDPEERGWKPPTKYILDNRNSAAPGVQWYRPISEGIASSIGVYDEHTFLTIENGRMVAINIEDGTLRWQLSDPDSLDTALLDQTRDMIYLADRRGNIAALQLQHIGESNEELELELLEMWAVDLDAIGGADLLPLPEGGVVIFVGHSIYAFSEDGQLLWRHEARIQPRSWIQFENQTILSSVGRDGSLWSLDEFGIRPWSDSRSGKLLNQGDQSFLYGSEGIYLLDVENQSTELHYQLPRSFLGLGDGIVIPEDGLLLAHRDLEDERLILLQNGNKQVWQRSYSQLSGGRSKLVESGSNTFLIVSKNNNIFDRVTIFSIDFGDSEFLRLFDTVTDSSISSPIQAFPVSEELILIYAGNGLVALNPEESAAALNQMMIEP